MNQMVDYENLCTPNCDLFLKNKWKQKGLESESMRTD